MMEACKGSGFTDVRDRAILFALLDTGARATEFCMIDLDDLDLTTGAILIRQGKGRKPRMVYLVQKSRRAIRAYLRMRHDNDPALWVTDEGGRLTYWGLRGIINRRAKLARVKPPTAHDFRRAFALNMLRAGVDVFTIRRLMGHASDAVLRRYLALTDQDTRAAHAKGSPVDRLANG
jgi:site-specific recombinase XerD